MTKRTGNRPSRPAKSSERALGEGVRGAPEALAAGEVVLYRARDGRVELDVRLERDTVWLSLSQMAKLFGRDKSVISRHLSNIFTARELHRSSVVAENATTAADGKTYRVEYFNLDAILSVGYLEYSADTFAKHFHWLRDFARDHAEAGAIFQAID